MNLIDVKKKLFFADVQNSKSIFER